MEVIKTEEDDEHLIMDNSKIIKRRLKNFIFSDQFCSVCYEESTELYSFNTELEIFGDFGFHEITVINVVKEIFKKDASKVIQDIYSQSICSTCLEQLNKCYLFISNMEYNYKVMTNYMDQLQVKISEVDFIDNQENISIVLTHSETVNNSDNAESRIQIDGHSHFRCSRCNFEIQNYDDLRLHEKTHRWKAKINCNICKEVVYKQAYQQHLRIKHTSSTPKNSFNSLISEEDKVDLNKCKLCSKDIADAKTHKCHYSCTECDLYHCIHFKYLPELRQQMLNNRKLTCPENNCDYSCKSRKQMIGHLNREHLDHHPFTCDMCQQQFYSKLPLKKHIIKFHSPNYYCDYCDQDFSQNQQLFNEHLKTCSETKREYSCKSCVASFKTHESLESHILSGCRNFPCPQCKCKFTEEQKLSEHKSRVHGGVQCNGVRYTSTKKNESLKEQVTCEICGVKAATTRKLKAHQTSCHVKVICPECGLVFTRGSIYSHMANHSQTAESLTCEHCGKVSKNMLTHRRHKKWHTEAVPCPICSKLVPKGKLQSHTVSHSKRDRNTLCKIKCSQCDYRTITKNFLEEHINQVHLKIRPYICSICNKGYCGQFGLKKHMEAHTRPKEVICNICDARLINKTSYRKHMSRHTGDCPYKCDSCERAFVSITLLKDHKATQHSNSINATVCPLLGCYSRFSDRRRMRQHVKSVHWKSKDKPFDIRDIKGLDKKFYYLFEDRRRKPLS